MKNLGNMLKQAQQMQTRMQEMQAKLEQTEVEGAAGGGMVKVLLSGKGDLRRVTIDPSLMTADDREVLEDLMVAATPTPSRRWRRRWPRRCRRPPPHEPAGGLGGLGGLKLPF
jgi:DNA-binding YbaB/EbfC family protein